MSIQCAPDYMGLSYIGINLSRILWLEYNNCKIRLITSLEKIVHDTGSLTI